MADFARHLVEHEKPQIVLAGLLYDSASPLCSRTIATCLGVMSDVNLSSAAGPAVDLGQEWPVAAISSDRTIRECLDDLVRRLNELQFYQWIERLGRPIKVRRQGLEHPQVIMVMPGRHLADVQSRQALVDALVPYVPAVAAFTIIFLFERNDPAIATIDTTGAEAWLRPFEALAPCRAALHVAVPALDRGRPIAPELLADLLGICIASDVILDGKQPHRTLTAIPQDNTFSDVRTLDAIGLKAMWFSPDVLSSAWQGRFTSNLLRATSLSAGSAADGIATERLPSPLEVLEKAVATDGQAHRVSLKTGSSKSKAIASIDEMPSLVGSDSLHDRSIAMTFAFKGSGFHVDLQDLPRGEWMDGIYTWDFIHRKEALAELSTTLVAEIARQEIETQREVTAIIGEHIRQCPSLAVAASQTLALASRFRGTFSLSLGRQNTPDLRQCLESLGEALAQVPNRLGLAVRSGLLIAVQLIIGLSILTGNLSWKTALIAGLALLLVFTLTLPVLKWLQAARAAEEAAQRAVETIESRCRLEICERVREELKRFGDSIAEHLERVGSMLAAIHEELLPYAEPSETAAGPLTDDMVLQHLPGSRRAVELYNMIAASEATGTAAEQWTLQVRNELIRSLGTGTVPKLGEAARELARKRLRDRLRGHSLRHFLDGPEGRSAIDWMLSAELARRFFFDGRLAPAQAQGRLQVEYLLVPRDIAELRAKSESLPRRSGCIGNLILRVASVTLVESRPQG